MNSSSLMSRLGVKVTAIALIALAITFGIFLLIYEVAVPEFLYGEISEHNQMQIAQE